MREFLGALGCRPPLKLSQDRGQSFRDGLLDGIQLGPECSPECQQPRHSLCALIKRRRSTTFPPLLASSMKFRGINGHDDLGIFKGIFYLRPQGRRPRCILLQINVQVQATVPRLAVRNASPV